MTPDQIDALLTKTNMNSEPVFARPAHPLGPCGEPLKASVPIDIVARIERIAEAHGLTISRLVADILCEEFGTAHEREMLRVHGRIVPRNWRD